MLIFVLFLHKTFFSRLNITFLRFYFDYTCDLSKIAHLVAFWCKHDWHTVKERETLPVFEFGCILELWIRVCFGFLFST